MVDDYALANGARRVTRIRVRLGVLSALTRALHVSFRSASRGTSCEGAVLDIEEIPLTVYCRVCDGVKTPSGPYNFRCPDCGRATPEVVTGREMQLVSIVLERVTAPDRRVSKGRAGPNPPATIRLSKHGLRRPSSFAAPGWGSPRASCA